VFKRSGEITEWGCKWDSGGLALYGAVMEAIASNAVSSKFPHRVVELLEPYLTEGRGLARQADAESFDAVAVIQKEFAHAISRQSTPGQTNAVQADLEPKLTALLSKLANECDERMAERNGRAESKAQSLLRALIGLCQTVAFAHRTTD
jgi:hypothetical protein